MIETADGVLCIDHEPDFSADICEGVTIDDLDIEAIRILKQKYATKQKNPDFLTLPDKQVLSDLFLIRDCKVTNAALILVGKEEILTQRIPQAAVFFTSASPYMYLFSL